MKVHRKIAKTACVTFNNYFLQTSKNVLNIINFNTQNIDGIGNIYHIKMSYGNFLMHHGIIFHFNAIITLDIRIS